VTPPQLASLERNNSIKGKKKRERGEREKKNRERWKKKREKM